MDLRYCQTNTNERSPIQAEGVTHPPPRSSEINEESVDVVLEVIVCVPIPVSEPKANGKCVHAVM